MDISNFRVISPDILKEPQDISITLSYNGNGKIHISRACLEVLDNPKYILMAVNPERKVLILRNWREKGGHRVVLIEDGACIFVGCSHFLTRLAQIMGWTVLPGKTVEISGTSAWEGTVEFPLPLNMEPHLKRS